MRKFVDANIFLRFLTKDDPQKGLRCKKLLEKAQRGETELYTSHLVVAEVMWTLQSRYKLTREDIAEKMRVILEIGGLKVDSVSLLQSALLLYEKAHISFIDAYNVVLMKAEGIKEVVSFDKDFDKLKFVKRIEP